MNCNSEIAVTYNCVSNDDNKTRQEKYIACVDLRVAVNEIFFDVINEITQGL